MQAGPQVCGFGAGMTDVGPVLACVVLFVYLLLLSFIFFNSLVRTFSLFAFKEQIPVLCTYRVYALNVDHTLVRTLLRSEQCCMEQGGR